MNETKCEKCVFALWMEEDSSVGMQAYVEECKWKSSNFDDVSSGETDECSFFIGQPKMDECLFFIEQLIPEYEIVRCPKCNGRNTVLICLDENSLTGNFKCNKCDNEFVSDLPMY